MNVKHNLFPKLIECRRLLGYTQPEMAAIAGVSPETYKKHERGEFEFRLSEMLAIQENINNELQTHLTLDELFQMGKNRLNALYGIFKALTINHKGEMVDGAK